MNLFFLCVLDIDLTRNGNNLKLKVKSEFSLIMGLMVINHSNSYIHSTTILCDIAIKPIMFVAKEKEKNKLHSNQNFELTATDTTSMHRVLILVVTNHRHKTGYDKTGYDIFQLI